MKCHEPKIDSTAVSPISSQPNFFKLRPIYCSLIVFPLLFFSSIFKLFSSNLFFYCIASDNLSAVVLDNDNDNEDDLPDTPPNKSSKANRAEDSERLVSQITPLGFHLAALPINPRIGKLILFGTLKEIVVYRRSASI